jgi:hypothetical protein
MIILTNISEFLQYYNEFSYHILRMSSCLLLNRRLVFKVPVLCALNAIFIPVYVQLNKALNLSPCLAFNVFSLQPSQVSGN